MTTFESFSGTHPYRLECAANAVELDWHGQIPEAMLQDAMRRHSARSRNCWRRASVPGVGSGST